MPQKRDAVILPGKRLGGGVYEESLGNVAGIHPLSRARDFPPGVLHPWMNHPVESTVARVKDSTLSNSRSSAAAAAISSPIAIARDTPA